MWYNKCIWRSNNMLKEDVKSQYNKLVESVENKDDLLEMIAMNSENNTGNTVDEDLSFEELSKIFEV